MYEGTFYHIYNRGVNKGLIFLESRNYDYFLRKLDSYTFDFVDIYSYCLMPNHFHLLARVKEKKHLNSEGGFQQADSIKLTPIEKAFRDFFISYAKTINKEYDRTGALFQFKYKRKPIRDEIHLL